MPTQLLLVALTSLDIHSETSCPSAEAVVRELGRAGPRGDRDDGRVRIVNLTGQVFVVLHANDGREIAAARAEGTTCDEVAQQSARVIAEWEGEASAPVASREPEDLGRFVRVLGAIVGTGVGALLPLAVTLVMPLSERRATYVLLQTVAGVPVTALTALVGHRLAGGKGHYGAAVGGAFLGIATTVPFALLGTTKPLGPYELAGVCLASVVLLAAPALFLELADARERDALSVGVTPLHGGGAGVSIGGRI